MGLMDILNGMQNGPRGAQQPGPAASGGMPTWMMAVLGLLAYKAYKGGGLGNILGGNAPGGATQAPPPAGGLGGMLGSIFGGAGRPGMNTPATGGSGLGGLFGGLLAGGAAGSLLNGGLRNLIGDMQQNGQGNVAQSWVGAGANDHLAPNDLAKAIGSDDIDQLSSQVGVPRDQLLSDLSNHLPEFVNQLTPDGQMPSESDASRWV